MSLNQGIVGAILRLYLRHRPTSEGQVLARRFVEEKLSRVIELFENILNEEVATVVVPARTLVAARSSYYPLLATRDSLLATRYSLLELAQFYCLPGYRPFRK